MVGGLGVRFWGRLLMGFEEGVGGLVGGGGGEGEGGRGEMEGRTGDVGIVMV